MSLSKTRCHPCPSQSLLDEFKNDPLIYYRETIYTEQFEIVSRSTHCPKSRVAKLRTCWMILLRVLETPLRSLARIFACSTSSPHVSPPGRQKRRQTSCLLGLLSTSRIKTELPLSLTSTLRRASTTVLHGTSRAGSKIGLNEGLLLQGM